MIAELVGGSSRLGRPVLLTVALLATVGVDLAVGLRDTRPSGPAAGATAAPASVSSRTRPGPGSVARGFALGVAGSDPATAEAAAPPVPAPLVAPGTALTDGPAPVSLELSVPTLGLRAQVIGVGITDEAAMDAPVGPPGAPVWQQAFWYRGSAVPGAASTALIAGHVGAAGGRPGVFSHLEDVRVGDPVELLDTRTGLVVRFVVHEVTSYSLADAGRSDVLARIYGAGPVTGNRPQRSDDGGAHLTLVTCAGTFRGDTHDRRLVVYATRVS